jgi:hypothetical protein
MTEHTPGPWVVTTRPLGWHEKHTTGKAILPEVSVRREGDYAICGLCWQGTYDGEQHHDAIANARLIAAAPDLLEALEGVQRLLGAGLRDALSELTVRDYLLGGETTGIIAAIGAAIAKARGEQP